MSILRFKRFSRPQVLKKIRPPLLLQFLEKFQPELSRLNIILPSPQSPETEWLGLLARQFCSPETLPDALAEALYAIEEMASPAGQEQLERALEQAGLDLELDGRSSREELALQVWLSAPQLLARLHNQQRLRRLAAFEYFGTTIAPQQRPAFKQPDVDTLRCLTAFLEPWFARHHRGANTTRLELYALPENQCADAHPQEFWFLVRHGEPFTRTPSVDAQKTEILHFRPERDDVVVYSATRDEIRLNSRTRGERDLYVRAFGQCLRGSEDYFSVCNTYTLEPLRRQGADALQTDDVPGLEKITLREIQIILADTDKDQHMLTRQAADLFHRPAPDDREAIPSEGKLRCAAFDLHFSGCSRPRPLHIRPPNVLKLGRHSDVHLVDSWLARRGFRVCGIEKLDHEPIS